VTVVASYSGEVPLVPEEPQSEIVEPLSWEEEPSLGLQIASGALSLLYAPVKFVYAGLEGFMGGLAYLLMAGNEPAAQSVWDASLQGAYWVKAKHLSGEEAIHFKGEPLQITPNPQVGVDGGVGAMAKSSRVSLGRKKEFFELY
jgi:hypothetical protein